MRKESSGGDVSAVEIVAGNVLVEASLIDLHHGCGEGIHAIALAAGAESSGVESARGVGPEERSHKSAVTVEELLSAGAQDRRCVIGPDLGVELSQICVVTERGAKRSFVLPRSAGVHALDEERSESSRMNACVEKDSRQRVRIGIGGIEAAGIVGFDADANLPADSCAQRQCLRGYQRRC